MPPLGLAGRLLDRLAQDGGPRVVFGTHDMKLVEGFPGTCRRLAERPANMLFLARSLFNC